MSRLLEWLADECPELAMYAAAVFFFSLGGLFFAYVFLHLVPR